MTAQLAKPKLGRPKATKDTRPTPKQELILKTKAEHPDLTTREIGAIADASHVHVIKTLSRYGIDRTQLEDFKTHRADILAGLQHKLLISITDDELKKMPTGSKVLAACQLFDKERLQNDLSTSNVASVMADVAALRKLDDHNM